MQTCGAGYASRSIIPSRSSRVMSEFLQQPNVEYAREFELFTILEMVFSNGLSIIVNKVNMSTLLPYS